MHEWEKELYTLQYHWKGYALGMVIVLLLLCLLFGCRPAATPPDSAHSEPLHYYWLSEEMNTLQDGSVSTSGRRLIASTTETAKSIRLKVLPFGGAALGVPAACLTAVLEDVCWMLRSARSSRPPAYNKRVFPSDPPGRDPA